MFSMSYCEPGQPFSKGLTSDSQNNSKENTLNRRQALNQFFAQAEKRAFKMAQIATGHHDEALDIVQDAMMMLVRKYADRSEDEWGALFYRIVQNRIRDWYRRQKVRNIWHSWFGSNDKDEELQVLQPHRDEDLVQYQPVRRGGDCRHDSDCHTHSGRYPDVL